MGAASYVGRVGRLAVALGVGTAIATGHGVALADDSPTSDNSSVGTVQSADTAGTAGPEVAAPQPKTEPATTPATTEAGASTTTETTTKTTTANTSTTVAPGVVVSAQTTTGTAGSTKTPESPTENAEPTTQAPEPTQAVEPTETAEPTATAGPKPTAEPDPTPNKNPSASTAAQPTKAVTRSAATVDARAAADSAADKPDTVTALAASTPADADSTITAPSAARVAAVTDTPPAAPVAAPNPLEMVAGAVSSVVSNVLGWAFGPIAGAAAPSAPVQAPLAWTLLAYVRREIDGFVSSLGGGPATNVALAASQTTTSLALAAASVTNVPGFPLPGAQLSPSTQFVNWVTGNYYDTNNSALDWPDTLTRFGVSGTDIGVMWDNGMVDDPSTPYNEHQILMAFGDTFGLRSVPGEDWRFNVLMRSADTNLANGIDVPDGEFGNGNMFGGMPLWDVPPGRPYDKYARRIINPEALPPGASAGITLIPTAGISLPTPGTQFGVTQYLNFMSVTQLGRRRFSGRRTTPAIAYSTDNGENWTVAPTSIRYNDPWSGNANFQQGAFVRPGDGYVYTYGTPNGRQGAAYVSRVAGEGHPRRDEVRVLQQGLAGGWFGIGATPAGWQRNNPAAATPVFGAGPGRLRGRQRGQPGQRDVGPVQQTTEQVRHALRRPVQQHRDADVGHARRARGRRRRC